MKIEDYSLNIYSNYRSNQKDGFKTSTQTITSDNEFKNNADINSKSQILLKTEEKSISYEEAMLVVIKLVDESISLLKGIKKSADDENESGEFGFIDTQNLSISTKGVIKAKDKTINIDMNLNLHHTFSSKINPEALKKIDPLVITLDGKMPEILDESINFDIDADGESDQISKIGKNSGFLALDINKNGKIDDGSELFGTKFNNGFAELGLFDDDKNGWIDENDDIFDKLRIWKNSKDEKTLLALGEVGIGAIFLGNSNTHFKFKDMQNQTMAELNGSGVFLFENGNAGYISQIDFYKFSSMDRENLIINNNHSQTIKQTIKNQSQINIQDVDLKSKTEEIYKTKPLDKAI